MLDLLQLMLDGLLDGGVYALLGLGLSLTFGCLRRLNLAYGATAMLAQANQMPNVILSLLK